MWREIEQIVACKSVKSHWYYERTPMSLNGFILLCELIRKKSNELFKKFNAVIIPPNIPRPFFKGFSKITINETKITFTSENLNLDVSSVSFSGVDIKKNIQLPNLITPQLAEEIGMHLGDGFLSAKKNDYRLKGHMKDERYYYLDYIRYIYKFLYNIDLKLKDYENTIGFELYSKALWEFKVKVLGIVPGRKNNISMPDILKVNNKQILTSFIRGFMDTDGSISFVKNGYLCISAGQKSHQILKDIAEVLKMLGFSPRLYRYEPYSVLVINGFLQFKHYEETIGWSSPKHLKKIQQWKGI
jgi:intein/homing endonuclease